MCTHHSKVWVVSGYDEPSCEENNLDTDSWTELTPIPFWRSDVGVSYLTLGKPRLVVVAGRGPSKHDITLTKPKKTVWIYDLTTGTWTCSHNQLDTAAYRCSTVLLPANLL